MSGAPPIPPDKLLLHMDVPDHPRVYLLGCMERRVTVYSQQVRALNLVYALVEQELVATDARIAVIGGGVAGLTTAAAAVQSGMHATTCRET